MEHALSLEVAMSTLRRLPVRRCLGFRMQASALLVVVLGAAMSSPAPAMAVDRFASGEWHGQSFPDDGGEFTHCAMSASYLSGISLLFSLNSSYSFTMGFASPGWALPLGDTYPLLLKIDRIFERKFNATATHPN